MESIVSFVVGLVAIVRGVAFFVADPHSPTSRPLSAFWVVLGITFLLNPVLIGMGWFWVFAVCETLIFLFGLEWGLRVARTQARQGETVPGWWTRTAQASAACYGALSIAFPGLVHDHWKIVWTAATLADPGFYLFATPFFAALALPVVPFVHRRYGEFDPAELLRLLALIASVPFWIAGMILPLRLKPIAFALGEVVYLG